MGHRPGRRRSLVTLLSITLFAASVMLPAGHAAGHEEIAQVAAGNARDGRVQIRSLPFTITKCGSYVLTRCLTGVSGTAGITIDAQDVTLDLNGFTLRGVPGSLQGIVAQPGRDNVSVTNGTIRDWGGSGVDLQNSAEARLDGLRAVGNGGFGLGCGLGGVVSACSSANNAGDGISVGFGGIIRTSAANGNGLNGIVGQIAATSTGCVIESCTARSNAFAGILSGDGSTIRDSSVAMNGTGGISVGLGCTVAGCSVVLNGEDGINAFDSLVIGNSSRGNAGAQINAPNSTVLDNHQ